MLGKIEKVIEEKVRPSLLSHEGDVQIVDFTDGILRIRLTGQCSGCPSAKLTTEELIGKTVMSEIPEVTDVVLVNEVNPELLDFAKKLLNHQIER
ncbi:MAG: NifU family protein [Clostridiales bacterium]|nr:NifU family protein [Clostridiales bacterium]